MLLIGFVSSTGGLDLHRMSLNRRSAWVPFPGIPDAEILIACDGFEFRRADPSESSVYLERRPIGEKSEPVPFLQDGRTTARSVTNVSYAVVENGKDVAFVVVLAGRYDSADFANAILGWYPVARA